jgi:hypothetical protein
MGLLYLYLHSVTYFSYEQHANLTTTLKFTLSFKHALSKYDSNNANFIGLESYRVEMLPETSYIMFRNHETLVGNVYIFMAITTGNMYKINKFVN